MATILIESDDGALASASAVLRVRATNAEYNQPALRIDQAGARGGAVSIKIVDPNPDIEFVESDTADADDPARGKYEIAVQSDELQINGRKDDDSGFETIMVFQRPGAGGTSASGRAVSSAPARVSSRSERQRHPIGQSWWRRRPLCRGWGAQVSRLRGNGDDNRAGLTLALRTDGDV